MNNPDKMKFETPNITAENVAKIAALFPGTVTEGKVNIDLLRTMLCEKVFADEAYEFTWVGKRDAIVVTLPSPRFGVPVCRTWGGVCLSDRLKSSGERRSGQG